MNFAPSRLILARMWRRIRKTELAGLLDVTIQSVSAFERGAKTPSKTTLQKISEALTFPESFFTSAEVDIRPVEALTFRSPTTMRATVRDAARAACTIIADILSPAIEDQFELPEPDVPDLRGVDPETAAAVVRAEWGLGHRPIPHVLKLLESRGIRVFSVSNDLASVDAFSFWRGQTPFVVMHTEKAETGERPRFDGSHELAHLTMHRGQESNRDLEREADRFASAFLMPMESIIAEAPNVFSLHQIEPLKRRWGVSYAAYVRRLFDLGRIDAQRYQVLCVDISRRGYRKREPNGIRREAPATISKIAAELEREGKSLKLFAAGLGFSAEDFSALTFNSIPRAFEGGGSASLARGPTPLRLLRN